MKRSHFPLLWLALALLVAMRVPASGQTPVANEVRLVHLNCEDLSDPMGIDRTAPRLSWKIESDRRGACQTAYRILVASRPELLDQTEGDLWDSGRVSSGQSNYVPYRGSILFSGEDCWWKVMVWDEAGASSPWSAPARWSMGLLQSSDWTGAWIGKDEHPEERSFAGAAWIWTRAVPPPPQIDSLARYFRFAFELPAGCDVRSAHVIAFSPCNAVAFINGFELLANQSLGSAAGMAQDFDITWRLTPGVNLVAFSLQPEHSPGLPAGLLARVEVELMDGRQLAFGTDGRWKVSAFPGAGWSALGFDDSGWELAREEGAAGAPPWGDVFRPASRRLAARWLRREFSIDRPIRRARVYYCGLGASELYINGARIGDEVLSPGLSEIPVRAFYLTHDVTAALASGLNAIGAVLGNGRYYAPRRGAPFGDVYPKLLLKLVIDYQDGSRQIVDSGPDWKLSDRGPILANSEYDGEEFDARRTFERWSEAGFDDSHWTRADVVSPAAHVLSAQMFPPMRVTATLAPQSMREIGPGVYLFDLGQNMVGRCRLRVRGAAGTRLVLRHAETIDSDGKPRFANLRTAMATDVYILKGGAEETYEPRFTSHGFRYVELRGYPGKPELACLEGRVVHDDLEPIGSWTSSNALLNRIYATMSWGIRGNYRSIPTDCPQRDERQGWMGDRAFESKGEAFVFRTAPLYRKWFQDMVDAQRADGSISDVCPSYWPFYNDDVTWPGTFLVSPEGLYEQSGDPEFVTRHYPAMCAWIGHMETYLAHDLMPKDRYGDWCPPPGNQGLIHAQEPEINDSPGFIATSNFYEMLVLMQRYAKIAGRAQDAAGYAETAAKLKAGLNARYLAPDGSRYDTGSQTSSILPLAFGLEPAERHEAIVASLARRIETVDQGHVRAGLVGMQHLMQTLSREGRVDLAYRMAVQNTYPGWGYMVGRGATTVWELWNGDTADIAMNSGNHVMLIGDGVSWLYEDLAGIRSDPDQPGYRHILMRPMPVADLTSVRSALVGPYGRIASAWLLEDGRFTWDVTVPPNSTATLEIPASSAETVTEGGGSLAVSRGLQVVGASGGRVRVEAASGIYRFVASR
jgi:alpha-L-rhamnosidase